jgi:predicted RNase H-like nuclease (RuvC/YqgF family)
LKQDSERLKRENAKLDAIILRTKKETEQMRKETEQMRKENERLAELESKIDSSFSKHGINLPLAQIPKQP